MFSGFDPCEVDRSRAREFAVHPSGREFALDFEDFLTKAAIGSFGIAVLIFIVDLFGAEVPSPV